MSIVENAGKNVLSKVTKLSVIVPALTVAVAFASCGAVGLGGYFNAASGLESGAQRELALVSNAGRSSLSMRLQNLKGDLKTNASGAAANLAFTDMNGALANVDKDRPAIYDYFRPEGSSASDRAELTGNGSKTMYAWRHQDVHGSFLAAMKNGGYGDIYAINPDGLVIYSVTKSGDFLQNVNEGELKDSGLHDAFTRALAAEKGQQVETGFAKYAPAGGQPSMFIAQPSFVSDFSGESLGGVVVVRIGSGFLDAVTSSRDGLGATGQTYLVNSEGKLLTDKPLSSEPTALQPAHMSDVLQSALNGTEGQGIVTGADGVDRMTVATPMELDGAHWAVVSEKSMDEAMGSVNEMRNSMIIVTLVTLGLAAIVSLLFSRSITRPLAGLVSALEAIAAGDTNAEIKAASRSDEIGDIGRSVVKIRQNAVEEQEQRAEEEARAARSAAEQRQEMLGSLAADFEASVGQVVEHVSRSAVSLRESAEEMRKMMETSGETSTRAAQASSDAMNEVQSIASASDQLSSSIEEISSLIERSAAVAQTATVRAESTNETVRSLAEAANRIGEVITLISDIADQTNLLALNATIEAARAGEAGRGFAVVASEVKELASQTGKATGEIQQQIDAIRQATDEAVDAIGEIQQTIGEISQSVTDVSAAVTEQSFATKGIAENTQRAAVGTSNVSDDISNVSQISAQTREAANGFAGSVEALTEQTNALDQQVRTFLTQVRSA